MTNGEGSVGLRTENDEVERQDTLAERVANALNEEIEPENDSKPLIQKHMFDHESPAFQQLKLKIM